LEYYDTETVDQIVARIEKSGGRPSALLAGVVESAPFQKTRGVAGKTAATENEQSVKMMATAVGSEPKLNQ